MAVLGPTASGKTGLAICLARHWGAEILSVDSMQVYRGMDIGTAKVSIDEQAEIPHHMIDLVAPEVDYTVAEFQEAGRLAMGDVLSRNVPLIVAGGSGLYFRSLVDPLEFPPFDPGVRAVVESMGQEAARAELLAADPSAGAYVELGNLRRVRRAVEILRLGGGGPSERANRPAAVHVRNYVPEVAFAAVGVDPGDRLADRVMERIDRMIDSGLLDEVAGLSHRLGRNASRAVGYRQMIPVVRGDVSLEQGKADTFKATMALARRQRTYFGRDPRIRWLEWSEDPEVRCRAARQAIEEMQPWSS
ncbi:MAG: tRNA (adenosine(37)-N6)-dimethylallyltransferase MiaA [bacterium]|nr:tRNA (adenosine(37)-N6)-dimethylallyltransferase MiaA [bacterium]MDE0289526.1 tRNA (adenosine(37)-N6)-dimethylallyltransferase MiaA [bacterium]MDE0439549.1 tRNA (adenosine(37)-N6)-dimethylallyltransferase MiaA [bacterium]